MAFLESEKSRFRRCSGILLPISALPGPYGIGTFGVEAHRWVDLLHQGKHRVWQFLPIGPADYKGCPYVASSSHGIDSCFVDLPGLVNMGFLTEEEIQTARWHQRCEGPDQPDRVDWEAVRTNRGVLLTKAYDRFVHLGKNHEFHQFHVENASWLLEFSVFHALDAKYRSSKSGYTKWNDWNSEDRDCESAMKRMVEFPEIKREEFIQWILHKQFKNLKHYAHSKGVALFGDMAFYLNYHSADCWADPTNFDLHQETFQPIHVSGAPPDYFSANGQLWGHPVFNWETMEKNDFEWWVRRFKYTYSLMDIVRLDHFRAMDSFWAIPRESAEKDGTAIGGHWEYPPGEKVMAKLMKTIDELKSTPGETEEIKELREKLPFRLVAEDLGDELDGTIKLRRKFEIPSMRVLQFAISEFDKSHVCNDHMAYNHGQNCVAYTATHDNCTTNQFYDSLTPHLKNQFAMICGYPNQYEFESQGKGPAADLIRVTLNSPAALAILPLQDVLALPAACRYNNPADPEGPNWNWRLHEFEGVAAAFEQLQHTAHIAGRW